MPPDYSQYCSERKGVPSRAGVDRNVETGLAQLQSFGRPDDSEVPAQPTPVYGRRNDASLATRTWLNFLFRTFIIARPITQSVMYEWPKSNQLTFPVCCF